MLVFSSPDTGDGFEAVNAGKHVAHRVDQGRNGVDGGVIEQE